MVTPVGRRKTAARSGVNGREPCSKLGRWPGRKCVALVASGPVVGSIVDPSLPDHDSGALFRVPGSDVNSGRSARRCAMAQKLFIGGLSFSTSSERLRELFAQAGGVESATVVTDRDTGRSRGFGFVEMATAEAAEAAVKKFNGQEVDGRTLKVELAKPSGSGGGRSGGGYRSGGGGRSGRRGRGEGRAPGAKPRLLPPP